MCTRRGSAGAVPGALRPWVAEVGVASRAEDVEGGEAGGPGADGPGAGGAGGTGTLTHLPDTTTELVFHTGAEGRGELVVLGPRTRAAYFAGKDRALIVRMRLRYGRAEPLLGVPSGALTDRTVRLDELWGEDGELLGDRLSELGPAAPDVLRHVEDALLRRLAHAPSPGRAAPAHDALLRSAARALGTGRHARVREVARELSISERRLHTLFTRGVGVSPKRFARIHRVRAAVLRGAAGNGARLATAAGFYDQSHMAAEFRALLGVAPGAFLAGQRPEARACGAG